MTQEEFDAQVAQINGEFNVSDEEKTRRINLLKGFYNKAQTQAADDAKAKQQKAESDLKEKLKSAFMANPEATAEDFEACYPEMKRNYLMAETLKREEQIRFKQSEAFRKAF